jgi:hypothetical protein
MTPSNTNTRFRIVEGPTHVRAESDHPLHGWYVVEFTTPEGASVRRLCTDKGRTRLLRRTDAGRRAFSAREVSEMTVAHDLSVPLQQTIESGNGA